MYNEYVDSNFKKVPSSWTKRLLKVCLTIIIPLAILYLLVALAPYLIKPEVTDTLTSGIVKVWGISSLIQYLIYALLAFYAYPHVINKKRLELMQSLLDFKNLMATDDFKSLSKIEKNEISNQYQFDTNKFNKINQLMCLKNQWIIMSIFIVFDFLAGQLPFLLVMN